MTRIALVLGCLGLAVYYGITLEVAAAGPGLVLAYLFATGHLVPDRLPTLSGESDPRAIKQYRVDHPGVGILEAAEAVARR